MSASTTGKNQAMPVLNQVVIAAAHESVFGTKRTFQLCSAMSAFGGKADINWTCFDVRFSNRPVGVKRFQAIHDSDGNVARGLVLLSGLGT